jgi:hypothetical protein
VKTLCEQCFSHCRSLSAVTFESGSRLSRIESYAFEYCTRLASICLPASLISLDGCAFYYCKELSAIYIPVGLETVLKAYRSYLKPLVGEDAGAQTK